ncbi:MAG TPA: CbiX/SirB N-terminal domain-containing protein [Actinocrinis sp.]|nr:CbiX/SirB N-terminal domain-containing protein [Actinocrinis sp.]
MTAAPRPGLPPPVRGRAQCGPGLLLIAHGSRDRRHARAIAVLAEAVRANLPGTAVQTGFLSLSEPSVGEAYRRLLGGAGGGEVAGTTGAMSATGGGDGCGAVESVGGVPGGSRAVRVVPLFLRAGYHVQHDVPAAVAEARRACPFADEVTVAAALGPDPLLAESFDRRIREAGCWPDDPELELVPAGATRQTEVDPAALAAPHPPGIRRRLVLARFLAPGELPDRARARAAAAGVPITEPLISESLGPAEELVRLVLARYFGDEHDGEPDAPHRHTTTQGPLIPSG